MPELSDEEIIVSYKNGDQEAFKSLIDKYASPLFNFTARLAGKSNAPDMVQEVFIKIWKNIGKFNPDKSSFKTWTFTIARNTVTDFLRKKKFLLFSDVGKVDDEDINSFAENILDESLLPDQILEKLEDKETLNTALEKLSPRSREILVLHYQEEMTFDEISKILGKPLNTVKSQHYRAILDLRKVLERNLP